MQSSREPAPPGEFRDGRRAPSPESAGGETPARPGPFEPEGLTGRLLAALLVSALCMLAAWVYFRTLSQRFEGRLDPTLSAEGLLSRDLNIVMAISFLCALVGFVFSRRYGLPGLGSVPGRPRDLGALAGGGIALGLLTLVAFDLSFRRLVPGYYPLTLAAAAATIPSSVLLTEVVVRFGMITILVGAFRRPLVANLVAALFFTLATGVRQLRFAGIRPDPMDPTILAGLALTLAAHGVLGTIYIRKGLFACVVFHLAMDLKYLLFPFI